MNNEIFSIFKQYLNSIYEIDNKILIEYFLQWNEILVSAKTIITNVGEVQKNMYFVLEGVQKSYRISNDKEHIVEFTYFPSLSGIPDSFVMQTPSKYFLETISNSRLLKISYEKHIEYLDKYRELDTLFRKITELILFTIIDRHYDLNAYDMRERFVSQIKKRPELLYLVPRKDLASYLRIDPTNLSKLINNVRV